MHPTLVRLGWDQTIASLFDGYAGLEPARVIAQHRGAYVVGAASGEMWAEPSGRLRHDAGGPEDLPATGDWVALRRSPGGDRGVIDAVLPRRTKISRKVAGFRTDEQVLAANVDVAFLAAALDLERIVNRLERYLVLAFQSGAEPVIVLTKSDLSADVATIVSEVEAVSFGVPIVVTSAETGEGLNELADHLRPDRTGVLLGHSGVGKSSLINKLCEDAVQEVRAIRAHDGRGRHTTAARELVLLPGGGALIDTPGLREIQLWDGVGVGRSFEDVADIASACRFRDCRHEREPGCAVLAAVEDGSLDASRLDRFRRIARELAFLERKKDRRAALNESRRWKTITRAMRERPRPD